MNMQVSGRIHISTTKSWKWSLRSLYAGGGAVEHHSPPALYFILLD